MNKGNIAILVSLGALGIAIWLLSKQKRLEAGIAYTGEIPIEELTPEEAHRWLLKKSGYTNGGGAGGSW